MSFVLEGLTLSRAGDDKVRRIGQYATVTEAVAVAKHVIDEFLYREFRQGMLPSEILAHYKEFGEVPVIFRSEQNETVNVPDFNHIQYATARCMELSISRRAASGN
jgi:hypothetical protein